MLFYLSSWQKYPHMREPRANFGIIWIPDGRLFAIGGKISSGGSTSTVEMFDTSRWGNVQASTFNVVWIAVASMSNPRESHGVAFPDAKLVAVGGTRECSVEVFTLPCRTMSWDNGAQFIHFHYHLHCKLSYRLIIFSLVFVSPFQ